jgi:hypothetical protein
MFPFTYKNGVLDLAYTNNFENDMVLTPAQAPQTEPDCSVRVLGGTKHVVTGLGPNLIAYIRAWRNPDVGSPINIYVNGVVQRVQWMSTVNLTNSAVAVSTVPPSGDEYIQADATATYKTAWVFDKPLTITTVETGVKQYITFRSTLEKD